MKKNLQKITNPQKLVICPACGSEVSLNEIIERRGWIGCTGCLNNSKEAT